MSRSQTLARRRPSFLYLAVAIVIAAGVILSNPAEARSVRVDSGGWTDGSTDSTGQLGFNFDFFGVETSTVQISEFGFVSFGGATISPFSNSAGQDFFWQNTADAPPPDPLDDPALPGKSADIGGKLAQLGSRLIQGTAKTLSAKFFTHFAETLNAEAAA